MYEFENVTVDVNKRDEEGRTLLHLAARDGNITFVDFLIHNGADVKSKDEEGRTPLHWAAYGGDLPAVAQLVHHGADIQEEDKKGRKPLHWAAIGGDVGTCNYLTESGGGIYSKDLDGKTPLELATDKGTIKYLGDFIARQEYNEKFRKRKPRSLPSVTVAIAAERSKPRSTFCTWIWRMIQTTDSSPSASPVSFIDKLGNLCSDQMNNFLMLAITFAEARHQRQRPNRQQNIPTPSEIVASRIDQFALDAIYNFPTQ